MTGESSCRGCIAGTPKTGARVCPECGHVFRGNGWDGIDAHWRSRHEAVEPYEQFFASLARSIAEQRRDSRVRDLADPDLVLEDIRRLAI